MRLGFACHVFAQALIQASYSCSKALKQAPLEGSSPDGSVTVLSHWDVLGPFRIGTREAVWGADPIELVGGIQHISPVEQRTFPSPLTTNATVHWSRQTFNTLATANSTSVDIALAFDEIDWELAQKIYGWAAFQYQAWVKGVLFNHGKTSQTVKIFTDSILELWVNEHHVFGGDFFGFKRVPVLAKLQPGANNISVRLVREVRSMGGILPPTVHASLRIHEVFEPVHIDADSIVLPDAVDGKLCTCYGSISVTNQVDEWIEVRSLTAISDGEIVGVLYDQITLAPGQSRPQKMVFDTAKKLGKSLDIILEYSAQGTERSNLALTIELKHTEILSPQKFTFLHPSGAVSYAILRPPATSTAEHEQLPVLLNLHGAGVEVDSHMGSHMFDDAPDLPAWILTPAGMSPWSGDDWHTWGFADAVAALHAILGWTESTHWHGPGVFTEKFLVTGHSNGGQGSWFVGTHIPDRLLAVAVASGYSSIENYVPFTMWSEADPLQSAILQSSRNSFRHEILLDNMASIPVFQQHGSADDNVPVYHSRLMNTLLAESAQMVEYSEMSGKGHWFEGVMTTRSMLEFFGKHLNVSDSKAENTGNFTFVVPHSHDMESKHGILVDQLSTPERLGKITVVVSGDHLTQWHLMTENIHRFHLDHGVRLTNSPNEILIDDVPHSFEVGGGGTSFVKSRAGVWGREVVSNWRTLDQRYGRQRGALDAILRSTGPFQIIHDCNNTLPTAVQASRNLLQYFGADSSIRPMHEYNQILEEAGNVITICRGSFVPESMLSSFPIRLAGRQVVLITGEIERKIIPMAAGMGGVWLRPLQDERLELVVWGYDETGLRQAARLIPTLTGAGVPDFVILSDHGRWKGHGGAVTMGFFDHDWKISPGSYVP